MNCAICQQPMKLIPAGVSKSTGNAYNAFWACNERTHKQPREQKPTPVQNFTGSLDKMNQDKKWQEISTGKVRHGFALEAYKMGLPLNNATITGINRWVNYVMSGQEPLIADRPVPNARSVEQRDESIIDASEIPF